MALTFSYSVSTMLLLYSCAFVKTVSKGVLCRLFLFFPIVGCKKIFTVGFLGLFCLVHQRFNYEVWPITTGLGCNFNQAKRK